MGKQIGFRGSLKILVQEWRMNRAGMLRKEGAEEEEGHRGMA